MFAKLDPLRTLSLHILSPPGLLRPALNQVPSFKSLITFVSLHVLQSVTGYWSDYLFAQCLSPLSDNELQGVEIRLIRFPSHQHSAWHMVGAQPIFAK